MTMDTNQLNEMNRQVIAEFRANAGKVGGPFEGAPVVLLHTTGAKSGAERINPLMYQAVGDDIAIFASKAGAPTAPDWLHNIRANANVSVEVGSETFDVTARILDSAEREPIWAKQKEAYPQFAEYEASTTRTIPVVILERR